MKFPRTDKWIERYNLRRGTGLEAFPMDLEAELADKDAVIADMGKRFDKLLADYNVMTARAEALQKERDALVAVQHSHTPICFSCNWKRLECGCPLYQLPCGYDWGGRKLPTPSKGVKP